MRPTKLGYFTRLNTTTSESKVVILASVTVDLTRLGFAVALVDEVAAACA